jgi:hypothetical protein
MARSFVIQPFDGGGPYDKRYRLTDEPSDRVLHALATVPMSIQDPSERRAGFPFDTEEVVEVMKKEFEAGQQNLAP